MAKKEQRFIKVMEDSGFISSNEVLVDTAGKSTGFCGCAAVRFSVYCVG